MLRIGITGNIGSGKTTVSRMFGLLGVPLFYADDAAKKVMATDTRLIEGIKQHFGPDAYLPGGALNRKYLAGIVFHNPAELQKLNALVHPAVFRAFDEWVLQQGCTHYVLKEAAVLFESGSYKDCDYTIVVTAPKAMRFARVIQRDGITQAEAQSRDARQIPEEEKIQLADFVIINDGTTLVIPQVLALHQEFLKVAPVIR